MVLAVECRFGHSKNGNRMKRECASCCELRQELVQLREASEARAREDHGQCVAMYQQMQELVGMSESLARGCNRPGGTDVNKSTLKRSSSGDVSFVKEAGTRVKGGESAAENEQMQIQRLQAIVVQQAKELENLRRGQRNTMADGRVWSAAPPLFGNQLEDDEETQDSDAEDATDCDDEDARSEYRSSKLATQLRKLPLTSLHAQLKVKDLQLKHLQQVVAKHETRLGLLVDKKRSMTQSFQQTARAQQAHLKKYLAYIRQQTLEKKALEQQVRELNQYVAVLEKKVVDCSPRFSRKRNGQHAM